MGFFCVITRALRFRVKASLENLFYKVIDLELVFGIEHSIIASKYDNQSAKIENISFCIKTG